VGALRGAIVSGLGLALLYDVSSSQSGNVDTLFGLPGRLADYIINPNKPLIPDLRKGSSSSSTTPGVLSGSGTIPSTTQQLGGLAGAAGALSLISA
jgi:hypothetical protein